MPESILDIEKRSALYLNQNNTAAFIENGQNLLRSASINAQQRMQRMRDFKYLETNLLLQVPQAGALITDAYADSSVTVSGTLSPNVAGAFTIAGTHNGLPFYTQVTGGVTYFLAYSGTAWLITTAGFGSTPGRWIMLSNSPSPAGTYAAQGTNTGVATITQATGTVAIKRITQVELPIAGGIYVPTEFLTQDEWQTRMKLQIGRQPYNPTDSLATIGIDMPSPAAYLQGQRLFITPTSQFAYPLTVQLSVVQMLPGYTADADQDFFTLYAAEALMWSIVVECNMVFKQDVPRTEGNLEPPTALFEQAWESLLAWDDAIVNGTTTPESRVRPPNRPAIGRDEV